jgi:DNA-binding transcriptional ArsR family regulator
MSRTHNTAEARLAKAAPVFAALGDPTRLRVVARLCVEGPLSITHLSEGSKLSRQAVTKHLHVLSDAGLIRDRRRGRERIWELEAGRLEAAQSYLDRISEQWDGAISRLKALVER